MQLQQLKTQLAAQLKGRSGRLNLRAALGFAGLLLLASQDPTPGATDWGTWIESKAQNVATFLGHLDKAAGLLLTAGALRVSAPDDPK